MKMIYLKKFRQAGIMLLLVCLFTACATSRQAANSPLGSWDFIVKNTPYGNVQGQMVIEQQGDAYTGELRSDQGNVSLKNINISDKQLTSNFMMDGNNLSLKGSFEGDTFTGEVGAGGSNSFPITANRAAK